MHWYDALFWTLFNSLVLFIAFIVVVKLLAQVLYYRDRQKTKALIKYARPPRPVPPPPQNIHADFTPQLVVDSLREEVAVLRDGMSKLIKLDNPAMRWLHRALVRADEIAKYRAAGKPQEFRMGDAFRCRMHSRSNCQFPECFKIRRLEWMLARISCTAKEALDPTNPSALKACGRMAEEALSYDCKVENKEV